MRIQLLGPVQAFTSDDAPISLGGVRLRMLLARLAVVPGETVPTGTLIDELWGAEVPAQAGNALQALVSRLRKALGDAGSVESAPGGYRLTVTAADVDSHHFEALAARGRRELAAKQHADAAATLGAALALWHGAALADVHDAPFARPTAVRLAELRLTAVEDHTEAKLRLGRHDELLADLEAATAEHPLRERLAALRMRALHAAGRQADALAVFESVRERLAERLGVDPGEELRAAHLAVLRGEAGPRPAVEPVVGRLPMRLTSFVGRAAELDRLTESLAERRLVTVVGMGGTGKTRLAVEAVSRHPAHATGRVWFAALAGVGAAEDVPDAVVASLDSPALERGTALRPVRASDPVDRIVELLAGDESLLVLDNCEHLIAACAELAHRLLDRLPGLTILATSREPLAITGEALCPLGPLPVPDAAIGTGADESAAVRLFTDRATAVRPSFAVTESNIEQVAEICRRLDGLPLALELAAARLRAMSLEQIAKRLDDRFRLLTTGSRTALPRQRTLQAVIEWSWDLLSGAEQALARRLSLFAGGASPAAVEAVCGTGEADGDPVYVLGSLVEKSIVDAVGEAEPRYRMLESVRRFAADRLDAAGEREAVTVRFRHHFLAVAEAQERLLRTRDQLAAMAVLDTEHANLVAALRSAIDSGDVETAHRLLSAVLYHWSIYGAESRVEAFVAQVLRFGDALPADARAAFSLFHLFGRQDSATVDIASVRSAIEECLRTDATRRYPILLLMATTAAWTHGLDDLCEPVLRDGYDSPDPWVRAGVAWLESYIRGDRGDWDGAQTARGKALREFTEIGDRLGLSSVLADSGKAASVTGDHAAAVDLLERGVEVAAERGWEDEIDYRTTLALEHARGGDTDAAWRAIDAALRRARQGGHRQGEVQVVHGYAELHRLTGDLDQADETLEALTALTTRMSLSLDFSEVLSARTRMALLLDRGSPAAARNRFPAALAAARGMLDLPSAAELLARLLSTEDEPLAAARALGWSQSIRGVFDAGNRELARLTEHLRHRLGDSGYDRAFAAGAATPRDEVLKLLDAAAS